MAHYTKEGTTEGLGHTAGFGAGTEPERMTPNRSAPFRWLLAVFALSGFSGLIYQSIWSQYLGLTLGHAAYAQTLVLAIYKIGRAHV